ncbi:MAG: YdeI/OmpD-associated family protein, partial [Longimicrobiales bacterium]|nr:YdeI/OmpD-associated family protein [Longimicrobiales bacterium]
RQALRWGWIDGLRRSIDDEAYMIRFTPRRPDSHWSRKNVEMYREMEAEGLIEEPGRAAWEERDPENTGRASHERERAEFSDELRALLDANADAAAWFDDQPPGYRKTATFWVMSAKREPTRERRMRRLVEDSAAGRKIKPLRR